MAPSSKSEPSASMPLDDAPRSAGKPTTGSEREEDREAEEPREDTNNSDATAPVAESEAPPLPDEELPPPLPNEPVPDDGWAPVWDDTNQAFYFFNRFTGVTQWTNPRVPEETTTTSSTSAPGTTPAAAPGVDITQPPPPSRRPAGGYDPSIHGDYDPNAWYAQLDNEGEKDPASSSFDPANPPQVADYTATGQFNRFTGRWQAADLNPENFNDEAKSKNQMNAFFDVDAAANSHDGRSLKAERAGKKLSKNELKQFKEKRKARKEEKRRAWLRD